MKRILLYGATGRTGGQALKYALKKGYAVTALVRNPNKLTIQSENLTVVNGSPTNLADVRMAMKNCDAVIFILSALPDSDILPFKTVTPKHIMETAMHNTIQCMNEYGIKKIVSLSSLAVGDSYRFAPWFMRLGIKLTNLKISFADHEAQELLLRQSDLDWVIARPVGLNDKEEVRKIEFTYDKKPASFTIGRLMVAQFMVNALETNEFLHKAPVLSNIT